MSIHKNPAKKLLDFCRSLDAKIEAEIDESLRVLAARVHVHQGCMLESVHSYRGQLAQRQNPSVEEFCDLIHLLGPSHYKFSDSPRNLFITEVEFERWERRGAAPPVPERLHIMLMLLDVYLEGCMRSGLGRLAQSLSRPGGDDLLPGEWMLPLRKKPSSVTRLIPSEQWKIANVTLPKAIDWHDRPSNVAKMCEQISFEEVKVLIGDLMMIDIIHPAETSVNSSLHVRLQKIKGVGAKKARDIRHWLESFGCQIDE